MKNEKLDKLCCIILLIRETLKTVTKNDYKSGDVLMRRLYNGPVSNIEPMHEEDLIRRDKKN